MTGLIFWAFSVNARELLISLRFKNNNMYKFMQVRNIYVWVIRFFKCFLYRVITLQPKSSVRSPAKSSKSSTTSQAHPSNSSGNNDDKSAAAALSIPYIRRLSKKKWNTADSDEETALCHPNALHDHEVSIISSEKDESTAV